MHSEWHLDIGKLCFIFTKILCILAKQQAIDIDSYYVEAIRNRESRYPQRASHNTVDALEMERAFCHNLSDEVRQRFAAYHPGRKTQRERSATTVSAGVMRILSCCSHNQPAEVEEKSFLPAFFYGIYNVANLVCFHILRFSQNHSCISTNPHLQNRVKGRRLFCLPSTRFTALLGCFILFGIQRNNKVFSHYYDTFP